jgi:hypothetical protein
LAAFALFEAKATQFAPNPGVHPLEVAPKSCQAIVLKPSREEVVEFSDHLGKADTPMATGNLPDFILGAFKTLGGDPHLAVQEQPVTQKLSFLDRRHSTLCPVHAQPEILFQEPYHRGHHPLPRLQ